ncbi:putative ribosomal N-acetyltransferase YdaF [Clostridium sp. N3C]|uniref:GNAT family N-acetyltransferase n=1 Tax=Clostridium sp. N3C TaxID=1776758 RepID=UPI00092E1CE3|nr:GNAT family protein [Clostridium sp. N3C]SCN25820.1 putative ribosomal N-acetyltransferase YdaF [Clostridium sp. N3C]
MINKIAFIENVAGKNDQYIIKDSTGITAGRIFLVDYQAEYRSCIFRINYYRKNDSLILKEALRIFIEKIFHCTNAHKVNILIDEENDILPFTNLGFTLEGILDENIVFNGNYKTELLFGITDLDFERFHKSNVLKLKGLNIELKILTPEDAEAMLDYYVRNREFLEAFEPSREKSFYTLEVQKRILIESYSQYINGTDLTFGIFKDNRIIGRIKLSNIIMGVFRSCNIGYSLDKDYEGRGYMKEAVRLVIKYAFNEIDLHRIEASTLLDNIKSQRVLLSNGFKELGINKEYLLINGAWRDHKTFYIINNK